MIQAELLAARVERRRLTDPAWPLVVLTVGMPFAYLAGLSAFVWALPAIVFGLALWRCRSVHIPAAALPLAALTGWALLTIVRVSSASAIPLFLYRWLLWAGTVAAVLWLVNVPSRAVSSRRVVDLLAALFIVLVAFGYLALAFPTVESPSFVHQLLTRFVPGQMMPGSFLYDITIIRFAELQEFATGSVPRPAAPMAYTNGWGSTIGLLAPFFAISWLASPGRLRRGIGIVIAIAAVVPIIVSTNRGLWLSLGVATVYFGLRRAISGDARPLIAFLFIGALIVVVTLLSPLRTSIAERFSGAEDSNTTRERLYDTAFAESIKSPILGYGAPQSTGEGPAIGTHGLMWYVMFSHGFPAVALLVVAAGTLVVSTARARSPVAMAAHLCIVIFAVQIPFYGLLPQIVLVGIAAGIAVRESRAVHWELAA